MISELLNAKSAVFVGIGGEDIAKIARFLHLLGIEVSGFDNRESENTRNLELLGISIIYENPTQPLDTKFIIRNASLPDTLIQQLIELNPDATIFETGQLSSLILDMYEAGDLTDQQVDTLDSAGMIPLYKIDYSKAKFIGITGTDGKTTTTTMLYRILQQAGHKVAMITTISAKIGDREIDTGLHTTTPSALRNAQLIEQMYAEGCEYIILELTSQALAMGRTRGMELDYAVYTNITPEHLDYHGTFENYRDSKALLSSRHLKPSGMQIINRDDDSFEYFSALGKSTKPYSIESEEADLCATEIELSAEGSKFKIDTPNGKAELFLNMKGSYNISNALAAISVALREDIDVENIATTLANLDPISGRMETLQSEPFTIIVDFAHTPNGMEQTLKSLAQLRKPGKKLITVFGCAGKRDPSKRAKMGRISATYSDVVILTAEDPRSESLKSINDQISTGFAEVGSRAELVRFDDDSQNVKVRSDAIDHALSIAREGDIVVSLGKAHEQSLCFGQTEYDWNDIGYIKSKLSQ